jgi:hypothetical protein
VNYTNGPTVMIRESSPPHPGSTGRQPRPARVLGQAGALPGRRDHPPWRLILAAVLVKMINPELRSSEHHLYPLTLLRGNMASLSADGAPTPHIGCAGSARPWIIEVAAAWTLTRT